MYTMHLPQSLHKHDTKSSFTINIWFFNKLITRLFSFFFFSIFNDGSMTANQSKNMNRKLSHRFFLIYVSISIEYEIFFLKALSHCRLHFVECESAVADCPHPIHILLPPPNHWTLKTQGYLLLLMSLQ